MHIVRVIVIIIIVVGAFCKEKSRENSNSFGQNIDYKPRDMMMRISSSLLSFDNSCSLKLRLVVAAMALDDRKKKLSFTLLFIEE